MSSAIAEVQAEHAPVRESWGVSTYVTQQDIGASESYRRMESIADYVAWYDVSGEKYQVLEQVDRPVRVYLYDAEGDTSATVTATMVHYFESEDRLEAIGEVVAVTQDGTQLTTEWLEWRGEDRMLQTDRFVHIISATEDVEGYGLLATEDMKTYHLGRFTARVVIEE